MNHYQEKHRPQFHFSPQSMWMNDPNGMVYYDGEYHLFYQNHPGGNIWGPMHWGHAVSSNLVHWKHMPVALSPDEHGLIFSGSVVVDWKNSSGFGSKNNPPLVAIFTYHNLDNEKAGRTDFQTQAIAYSLDKGQSWTKYENNPVLTNPGLIDFRDPKIIWFEPGQKWIMALAAGDHLRFYSSHGLKNWTYESEFRKDAGAHGGVWECPDLFPLKFEGKEKWVLLVSLNSGSPNGGSGTQYFIGGFDGKSFSNDKLDTTTRWLDYGRDNYAGVTWSDIPKKDGRRIFIGWMSNWDYANSVPTERWCGAMTIPRTLDLVNTDRGLRLAVKPVKELKVLRGDGFEMKSQLVSGEVEILNKKIKGPFEFILEFKLSSGKQSEPASQFGVELSNDQNEKIMIAYEPANKRFFIDRSQSGKSDFYDGFAGIQFAPHPCSGNTVKMHLFVDTASVELFAQDGQLVMTDIFFPNEDFNCLKIYTKNGSIKLIRGCVYPLKSIWQD